MDPITGPVVLWLLVLWYLYSRFGGLVKATLDRQVKARALDAAATVAGRVGARQWGQRTHDAADRARKGPHPTGPRTSAGQTQAQQGPAGKLWRQWLRIAWADAAAAARAAKARAAKARTGRYHNPSAANDTTGDWWDGWRSWRATWTAWPQGDEPQAPKYATATRDDRPPTPPPAPISPARQAIDPAPTPRPAPPAIDPAPDPAPVPITTGRTNTMALELAPGGSSGSVVHANPGGVPVAEAGLSKYINWSAGHGVQCDVARANVKRTMAGMGNEQWTGEFLTLAERLAENYANGARLAAELNAMLVRCQDIRTAYKRNEGAGSRESILS